MAWYYYFLAGLALGCAAAAAVLFLPLRIFVFYLRENKEDRAALTISFFRMAFKLKFFRNGEAEVTALLALGQWEFKLPVFRRSGPGRDNVAIEINPLEFGAELPQGLFSRSALWAGLSGIKSFRPELKKITWRRFDLEVVYGLEDPSWVGLAYGAVWALGGAVQGLLYHLFCFEAAPRLVIMPLFNRAMFKVRWEGELTMSLFRGLKLLKLTRKIGGAISGTSSY